MKKLIFKNKGASGYVIEKMLMVVFAVTGGGLTAVVAINEKTLFPMGVVLMIAGGVWHLSAKLTAFQEQLLALRELANERHAETNRRLVEIEKKIGHGDAT